MASFAGVGQRVRGLRRYGGLWAALLGGCATDARQVSTLEPGDCASPPCVNAFTEPPAAGSMGSNGPATAPGQGLSTSPMQASSGSVQEAGPAVSSLAGARVCFSESRGMALPPAALYLMLDSSGSMDEAVNGTISKWVAIQSAVQGFLGETREADLLLGMQFFPLLRPGTKYYCTSETDCGIDGGPCYLKTCLQGSTIQVCRSDADCAGGPAVNPCINFGLCSQSDPKAPLACRLDSPTAETTCGSGLGTCVDFERNCTNAITCESSAYATPAVEIGPVASVAAAVTQTLTKQIPQGPTPTVPALQGALDHARAWSSSHAGQSIAVVLATDGLPTDCAGGQTTASSDALQQVLSVAAGAAAAVPTYVIGVLSPDDGASASNIDAIAQAGGTERALRVDANGSLQQQFLAALSTVRTSASACTIPVQSAQPLDFTHAEVQFDSGDGNALSVPYAENLLGCATVPQGWYYDVAPAQGQPSSVKLCPNLCQLVRAAPPTGLQLQISCAASR